MGSFESVRQRQNPKRSDRGLAGWRNGALRRCLLLVGLLLAAAPIPAAQTFDRWVHLAGAINFRDIGGYDTGANAAVAIGRVYRSAALTNVTAGDAAIIRSRGIGRVIELRTSTDIARNGADSALLKSLTYYYVPVSYSGTSQVDTYQRLIREHGNEWRQAFQILGERTNLPLVYHCQAGKDRAGVLTALVLTFLGVQRETVIQDYLLSNVAYGGAVVDRTWLEAALHEVDLAGGIQPYLNSISVTATVQRKVRSNLIVPRPASVGPRWNLYR